MTEAVYTYSIQNDFPNHIVNLNTLQYEILQSTITHTLDYIVKNGDDCNIWFKKELDPIDSTSTLPSIIAAHQGNAIIESVPETPDGVPIVRADSRPLGTETYFTMCGDSTGIGDGKMILWDFSNDDDLFDDPSIPSGYKAKKLTISFSCPVYLKDGTIYFFDAPWGSYLTMYVSIPPGSYYPNPEGSISASDLGLTDGKMYAYTEIEIPYQAYLMKHMMYTNCPMGDELNAEGAALYPIPIGWNLTGLIITPNSDNVSKGYGELELYRCHSCLLPGQTLQTIHS